MTAPLFFHEVQLGREPVSLGIEVAANRCTSIVGGEQSGVLNLGPYALGMVTPPSGDVIVFGENLRTMKRKDLLAFRRKVGYLPAGDGLLQNLTLRENVALPLQFGSPFSDAEIQSRLTILLAAAGLRSGGNLRPAQATDEDRRRTALARAIAFDPKLVILEQPFVGVTDRVAYEILEVARGGDVELGSRRTVLVVGSSMPAAVRRRLDHQYRVHRGVLKTEG